MPCAKHPYSVVACEACWDYDFRHPREDIRGPRDAKKAASFPQHYSLPAVGVSESTPGRGYDEEDAPGNEEGA